MANDKFTWKPGDIQWVKRGPEDKTDQGIRDSAASNPDKAQTEQDAIRRILRRGNGSATS